MNKDDPYQYGWWREDALPEWREDALMDKLVTLGHDLFQRSRNHHVIGIGQSPYYPMFAANCIAIAHGEDFSHINVPMSGRLLDVSKEGFLTPKEECAHENGAKFAWHMADRLGRISQTALNAGQIPLICDVCDIGASLASTMFLMYWYDRLHQTNLLEQTKYLGFQHVDPIWPNVKSFTVQNWNGRPIFEKDITFIPVHDMLHECLIETDDGSSDDSERIVPELHLRRWVSNPPLRPDNHVTTDIKQSIRATVAARFKPSDQLG